MSEVEPEPTLKNGSNRKAKRVGKQLNNLSYGSNFQNQNDFSRRSL